MSQVAAVSAPAQSGKSPHRCRTCGSIYTGHHCKNPNCSQAKKSKAVRKITRKASRAGRSRGRGFGWGAARVLSVPVRSASSVVSTNGDCLRELSQARKQTGECQFCGLSKCLCASEAERQNAVGVRHEW